MKETLELLLKSGVTELRVYPNIHAANGVGHVIISNEDFSKFRDAKLTALEAKLAVAKSALEHYAEQSISDELFEPDTAIEALAKLNEE